MSKNKVNPNIGTKIQRRAATAKKAKRNMTILISVFAVVVVAIVSLVVFTALRQASVETFSGGGQSVSLNSDGTFVAFLAHGAQKSGTFTRTPDGNMTAISFNTDGRIDEGYILNDVLYMPEAWDDSCGHGRALPKR